VHELRSALGRADAASGPLTPEKKRSRQKIGQEGLSLAAIPIKRTASRLSNERREDRVPGVVDAATLYLRRRKHGVKVVNVSPGGMMIETEGLQPRIGETVEIQFADCNRTKCAVRWVRERRIGIEFAADTTVIGSAEVKAFIAAQLNTGQDDEEDEDDGRPRLERSPRHRLIWMGTLHFENESTPIRLRNISEDGAMLESEWDFMFGTEVMLDLEQAGLLLATVRWSEGGEVGVKFKKKFDLKNLVHARTTSNGSPRMLRPPYLDPSSPWAPTWDKLSPEQLARRSR
jgi:hypothetical protein